MWNTRHRLSLRDASRATTAAADVKQALWKVYLTTDVINAKPVRKFPFQLFNYLTNKKLSRKHKLSYNLECSEAARHRVSHDED